MEINCEMEILGVAGISSKAKATHFICNKVMHIFCCDSQEERIGSH